MGSSSSLLQVTDLRKRFGGVVAVNNISFTINNGEMMGIVGPNGAGKTTLFNLITGFIRRDSGSIVFDGHEISRLNPYKISLLGLARTFQQVRQFRDLTVAETLSLPILVRRQRLEKESIREILIAVGLDGKENARVRSLSYVEAKSLEIAKCVASSPKLLLLDEPFGGLNVDEIQRISKIILRLKEEGRTTVIIEHRLAELLAIVERLLVMNFGEKLAEGVPQDVMKKKEVIEAYIGTK